MKLISTAPWAHSQVLGWEAGANDTHPANRLSHTGALVGRLRASAFDHSCLRFRTGAWEASRQSPDMKVIAHDP